MKGLCFILFWVFFLQERARGAERGRTYASARRAESPQLSRAVAGRPPIARRAPRHQRMAERSQLGKLTKQQRELVYLGLRARLEVTFASLFSGTSPASTRVLINSFPPWLVGLLVFA